MVLFSSLLILSCSWLNLLLKLSIEFFNSVTIFFNSRIPVWNFLMVAISLLNFSFCSYIVFLISFSYLCFLVAH